MLFSRFLKDHRGGVAPMFALALIPIVGLVGAAVDYSRASSIKVSLQAALDATALAMAKVAPTLTQSQLQSQTTAYFQAMFSHPEAKNLVITPTFTTSSGAQLTISASSTMDTAFMKMMGYSNLSIGSSSTVKWGMNRLRVALALDNTGSMNSDNKIGALKTATKSLLDQLKAAAAKNGDVYVSIIPFNKDVNIGKSNYNQSYIRWDLWDANNGNGGGTSFSGSVCIYGTLWHVNGSSWTNGGSCSGPAAGICYQGKMWNWNGTSFTAGGSCENHHAWNGCVTDRDQNHDTLATAPSASNTATLFPAEQYQNCPLEAKGLSYDWTEMKKLVDQMHAAGTTNQTIGLVWAWQSLVGGGPFTVPAKDPNYQYSEIIILMSDGLNTQNRWNGNGVFTSTQVDARTAAACTNAKAAGFTIYTVHVNTDGDPTSQILKNCASDAGKFYTVTSSSQIGTVFNQIGTNLSQLRIAK